ncbi:MAG: hypothetical protein ABIT36_09060 [Steroidobacteraceae bacterium]
MNLPDGILVPDALLAPGTQVAAQQPPASGFTADRFHAHVEFLADDMQEGRTPPAGIRRDSFELWITDSGRGPVHGAAAGF